MPMDKDKPKNSISHKQIEVVDIVLFQINCIEVQSQNIKYITAQHCIFIKQNLIHIADT